MQESEAVLNELVSQVQTWAYQWNERHQMLLASAFQDAGLPVIVEVLSRLHVDAPAHLLEASARVILSDYISRSQGLDYYRQDLWALLPVHPLRASLRALLTHVLILARQQPRSHPEFESYHALGLMTEEVIAQLDAGATGGMPSARRKRRKAYTISLAKTAELPDLSALTLENQNAHPPRQVDFPVVERRKGKRSETLKQLPLSIQLPASPALKNGQDWLFDWELWQEPTGLDARLTRPRDQLFFKYLPPLHDLISTWFEADRVSLSEQRLEWAELCKDLSAEGILLLSSALLPHPHQESYLRHAALLFHLKLLQLPLTELLHTLRTCFGESHVAVQRILPAFGYFLSCASYSFYGIQTQALKRLSNKTGYLYPLILEEWAKNQRIHHFILDWLPRKEKHTAKLLASEDWSFIFYILNKTWAQSVMRDVYGVFHGSSAFGNQIIDTDIAKGFGDLTASKGKSFLATSQIADLLRQQTRQPAQSSPQQREQQYVQYVQDRYRKDVLRKELRPNLNASTLKRIERFTQSAMQRGEQSQQGLQTICQCIGCEVFQSFSHLTPDRFRWLGYELTRMLLHLGAPVGVSQSEVEAILKGLVHAILLESARSLKQRANSNHMLGALLSTTLQACLDDAVLQQRDPLWLKNLVQDFSAFVDQAAAEVLTPFYIEVIEKHLAEEPVLS